MSAWDILPLHWGKLLVFFLLGVGIICGLEYLYWTRLDWAVHLHVEELPIFDFVVPGNLSAWFSSGLWFLSAAMCMVAFIIGRKQGQASQLSDIWLWATFGSLLLSADAVCQVKDFIRIVLHKFSGTNLYAQGEIWWIAVYVFIFGTIGSRLLIEMRHYLPACNAFFVAALSSLLACCIPLNIVELPFDDPRMSVVLRCALEMTGALFAVLAFSLFVRKMLIRFPLVLDLPKSDAKEQSASKEQTVAKSESPKIALSNNEKEKKKEKEKEKEKEEVKSEKTNEVKKSSGLQPFASPLSSFKSLGKKTENSSEAKPQTSETNFKELLGLSDEPQEKSSEIPSEEEEKDKESDDSSDSEEPMFIAIDEDSEDKDETDIPFFEEEKNDENDDNEEDTDTVSKTVEKRPVRTCQIVHPSKNGEKIVKVESLDEFLDDDDEYEKKSVRKKNPSKKRPKSKDDELFDEEDEEFADDFELDEDEEELLRKLLKRQLAAQKSKKAG